jgi:hypothetical protein
MRQPEPADAYARRGWRTWRVWDSPCGQGGPHTKLQRVKLHGDFEIIAVPEQPSACKPYPCGRGDADAGRSGTRCGGSLPAQ